MATIWDQMSDVTDRLVAGSRPLHSHDTEGAASYLLVEQEHEGSGQDGLQEFSFQAFEQAQHAILPMGGGKHQKI